MKIRSDQTIFGRANRIFPPGSPFFRDGDFLGNYEIYGRPNRLFPWRNDMNDMYRGSDSVIGAEDVAPKCLLRSPVNKEK